MRSFTFVPDKEIPPARPLPTNQHFSVGPDGQVLVDLSFVSEPLGLPGEDGYGWPQIDFHEAIGPENRYVIIRKLGWGMTSSTWLARDQQENSYVAVKIITGYYTDLAHRGRVRELEALKLMSSPTSSPYCLQLLSNFTIPGKGTAGEHLCLVTPLLGGDVKALVDTLPVDKAFPLPLAKRILLHVLRGIAHAHSRGVVHTDLKPDNIFFDAHITSDRVDAFLVSDPSRRHPPEASQDSIVEAAVSQPLPLPSLDEAMTRTFVVADFGSARLVDEITQEEITPIGLRPPEVVINGPWDQSVDIWTFGCLIFEFVTHESLFRYQKDEKQGLDETAYLLYQMMCYTGEPDFPPKLLQHSRKSSQYFNTNCMLKANPTFIYHPFELSIKAYKVIDDEDLKPTADLMRRCLCIDPENRASATELLADPWFEGVD